MKKYNRRSQSSPTLARLVERIGNENLIDSKVNIPGISTSQQSLPRPDSRTSFSSITSRGSNISTKSAISFRTPNIPLTGLNNLVMDYEPELACPGTPLSPTIEEDDPMPEVKLRNKKKYKDRKASTPFKFKNPFAKSKTKEAKSQAKKHVHLDPDQVKSEILDQV